MILKPHITENNIYYDMYYNGHHLGRLKLTDDSTYIPFFEEQFYFLNIIFSSDTFDSIVEDEYYYMVESFQFEIVNVLKELDNCFLFSVKDKSQVAFNPYNDRFIESVIELNGCQIGTVRHGGFFVFNDGYGFLDDCFTHEYGDIKGYGNLLELKADFKEMLLDICKALKLITL